ncbi:hypothetical protein [Cupriavidus necator]
MALATSESSGMALTVQYMRTVSSHNAKAGDFTQVRLIKLF